MTDDHMKAVLAVLPQLETPPMTDEQAVREAAERRAQEGDSFGSDVIRVLDAKDAEIAELVAALRRLAGNAGALRAFEDEIREAAGNTNWQCLMDAIKVADEVLAKAKQGTQ